MNTFRETIPHPKLIQLYDYWTSICDGRDMPARRDMDPLDIPRLLPNIVLFDVEYDPIRFRVRLYGTALTKISRNEITGRYLDEPGISPIYSLVGPANKKSALTKKALLLDAPYPPNLGGGHFYRLSLPLSDDGRQVSMLLTGFYREKHALAEPQRSTQSARVAARA